MGPGGAGRAEEPIDFVLIPEYVARSWWERMLYNQAAKQLRATLLGRQHTVVINIPYRRDEVRAAAAAASVEPAGTLVAGEGNGNGHSHGAPETKARP